jgi:hypothetical protein
VAMHIMQETTSQYHLARSKVCAWRALRVRSAAVLGCFHCCLPMMDGVMHLCTLGVKKIIAGQRDVSNCCKQQHAHPKGCGGSSVEIVRYDTPGR